MISRPSFIISSQVLQNLGTALDATMTLMWQYLDAIAHDVDIGSTGSNFSRMI
jgi:hypothetical protein